MHLKIKDLVSEIFKLTIMGLIVGLVVSVYKYLVFLVIDLSQTIYSSKEWYTLFYGVILSLILAFTAFAILRREPAVRGSGLDQLKEFFNKKEKNVKWFLYIPLMFFNSLITFFLGIPLGMEAPSTFMGAMCGYALDDFSRKDNNLTNIKICMGAGFSSAFLSPVGGFFYPFEKQKININFINILKAIYVSFISYFISLLFYDKKLVFIPLEENFDFNLWPTILVSIALILIVSFLIIEGAKWIEKIIKNHPNVWFIKYRFFIVYLLSLIILLIIPVLGGTGLGLISYLTTHPAHYLIILFLFGRIILFLFGVYSQASGGAFGTAVTLGSLIGYVSVVICRTFLDISNTQALIMVSICCCATFGTINKAPLTGLGLLLTVGHYVNIGNYVVPGIIIIVSSYTLMHFLKLYKTNK